MTDSTSSTPDNGRQTTGFSVELDRGYHAQVLIPVDITPAEYARIVTVLRKFLQPGAEAAC